MKPTGVTFALALLSANAAASGAEASLDAAKFSPRAVSSQPAAKQIAPPLTELPHAPAADQRAALVVGESRPKPIIRPTAKPLPVGLHPAVFSPAGAAILSPRSHLHSAARASHLQESLHAALKPRPGVRLNRFTTPRESSGATPSSPSAAMLRISPDPAP